MTERLKKFCSHLTLKEKVQVRDYLSASISLDSGGSKSPIRCSILMRDAAAVIGQDDIPTISRIPIHVWARTMVVYQMSMEGYTTIEIGDQMGKNHSSIIHMRNKMQDALSLPKAYGDIIDIWKQFQNKIQDEIHKGTN